MSAPPLPPPPFLRPPTSALHQVSDTPYSYFQTLCSLPLITLDADFCNFLKIAPPLAEQAPPVVRARAVLAKVARVMCPGWRVTCDV